MFEGDIKQLQLDLQQDIPTLEEAEARVIAGGMAGLDSVLRAIIEGYTVSITIKAVKNQ